MSIIDFFRTDLSEILGIYFDGDKIYFAHLADQITFDEISFELDANNPASLTEQLAATIASFARKKGWKTSQTALALRDGTAVTFQTEFGNIPDKEIESAVKIWATAHAGKDAQYSSVKFDSEIWMEALPTTVVEEYTDAWDKNSMNLCALTETPENPTRQLTPFNRAEFAAEIILNNAEPNILSKEISTWNIERIALTMAAVFLIALATVSIKLGHEYFAAVAQVESAQNFINTKTAVISNIENLDATTSKIRNLNDLNAAQNLNDETFNALIKIGRIDSRDIALDKIKATGETLELVGTADTPDAVKSYLSRMKTAVAANVKLENSTSSDGDVNFLIRTAR